MHTESWEAVTWKSESHDSIIPELNLMKYSYLVRILIGLYWLRIVSISYNPC